MYRSSARHVSISKRFRCTPYHSTTPKNGDPDDYVLDWTIGNYYNLFILLT